MNELELSNIVNELKIFLMPVATAIANRTGFNQNWPQVGRGAAETFGKALA